MLQATLYGYDGGVLGTWQGELGFSLNPVSWAKSAGKAIGRGAKSVAKGVGRAATGATRAVGRGVKKVGSTAYNGVKWAAGQSCRLIGSGPVQAAAGVASMVPDPRAQITGTAVQVAGQVCAGGAGAPPVPAVAPAVPELMPLQPTPMVFKAQPAAAALPATQKFPVGSIAASSPAGFKIAIPAGTSLSSSLAQAAFVPVGVTATLPAGVTLVSDKQFEDQTGGTKPFFRLNNPLMWAAIAGGVGVLGTGAYLLLRR